jgi:hypothetical protein
MLLALKMWFLCLMPSEVQKKNRRLCKFIGSFSLKEKNAFNFSQLTITNEREKHKIPGVLYEYEWQKTGDLDVCETRYY